MGTKRTTLHKTLKDKVYEIANIDNTMDIKEQKTGSEVSVNEQLAEALHKPVLKKFKRRKIYARFKDSI